MSDTVLIKKGSYRNQEIANVEFRLVKDIVEGKKGLFITVDGTGHAGLPQQKIRVTLQNAADAIIGGEKAEAAKELPDHVIMDQMREKFSVLDDMTVAAIDGVVRGMIVSGPPGIGKSFGVERIIDQAEIMKAADRLPANAKYGIEKGAASPIGLYMLLYQYSQPGSLLVLDDSDTILWDELSLNLLKAALDSGRTRRLSWRSESRALEGAGVPDTFEFKGSIMFITNLDFASARGKIQAHLEALMSRCHYLDMGIHGIREKYLRCKQIVIDGMLDRYGFENGEGDEVLNFIYDNQHQLRELSLRMVTKIADLRAMDNEKWQMYANNTCLR